MLKSNMLADGGVMQEGGTVDPVSGNDVPPGAMQEEVRDDIPAQLSEGEFVFSADVVRYWGLEKLMALRDKAKAGLKKMEDIGQMGNADQVEDPEALHGGEEMDDDAFSAEVDDIIGETDAEAMGGTREFNRGGLATPGTDYLAKYNIPKTSITNPALDVRAYKNADGRIMYITFFNGKPSTPIPEGFDFVGTGQEMQATLNEEEETPAEVVTATETIPQDGSGGGDGFDSSPTGSTGGGFTATDVDGQAMASTVSPGTVAAGLTAASLMMGVPAVATSKGAITGFVTDAINSLSHSLAAAANVSAQGSPGAVDSFSQASSTAATATIGPSGTGAAAAAAASAAASAAAAAGFSAEAQGAASQAAATAAVNGMSVSDATAAGVAAAVSSTEAAVAGSADADADAAAGDTGGGDAGTSASGGDGTGSGADAGSTGDCVDPNVLIMLGDKTYVPAGNIKVGDVLYAMHEKTLEFGLYPVEHSEEVQQPKAVVSFSDGSSMITSHSHKFFMIDGSWKQVYQLQPSDVIKAAPNETDKIVSDVEAIGDGPVMKITVKDAHTYISEGLISHNMKANGGIIKRKHMVAPTTEGPDDGYVALQVGEFVIKEKTTRGLGEKKLKALNEGRADIVMRKGKKGLASRK